MKPLNMKNKFINTLEEELSSSINGKQITKIRIPKLEEFYKESANESFIKRILKEAEYAKTVAPEDVIDKFSKTFKESQAKILEDNDNRGTQHRIIMLIQKIEFDKIKNFLKEIYSLGWFPAVIRTSNEQEKFSKTNFENALKLNAFILVLEKYYDNEEKYETLYHLTPIERWKKLISKQGLTPHTQSKISAHPKRVYMLTDESHAENLAKQLWRYEKNKGFSGVYALLEIDVSNLDIQVYDDPDYDSGVYTYSSIPLSNIKLKTTYDLGKKSNDEIDLEKVLNLLLRH